MTIKTRLLSAFSILIAMVVAMGTLLVVFGVRNRALSETRLRYYSRLFQLRDISQDFESQWRNLNYFVVLVDQKEKDNFRTQYESIATKMRAMPLASSDVMHSWLGRYEQFNAAVEESMHLASREKMFEVFSTDLVNRGDGLRADLRAAIEFNDSRLKEMDERIKHLNTMAAVLSGITGFIAVAIGIVMSFLIFRSISRPLASLQTGARIIGEGNLDYRIPVVSEDEIGKLAQSFNQMVGDLKGLQLQILQMDRMSSIGQLAGGVAHEINNPLTGVLGQAQLLLDRLPSDDPCRASVLRIESAAQRCRRIVRALLDFSRDKNYTFAPTDLVRLIDETLEFTRTEMETRAIQLVRDIPENIPQVNVSSGHIQQVLLNIVMNAIQAMRPGGTLTVRAGIESEFLAIHILDTGIGIRQENLNHVFDPFFTTKDIGQGTGLGLTISYGIVQRHHGDILVASKGEGKGAEFTVRLPLNWVESAEDAEDKNH